MASWQSELLKLLFRQHLISMEQLHLRYWDEHTSVLAFREYCERNAARTKLSRGIQALPVHVPELPAGLSAEWLQPTAAARVPRAEDAVIFYCHGGGYISGSCSDHRALVSKIVAHTGVPLLLYEYRLAPEHPYPAAMEDTLTAYRWLHTQIGADTGILIAGDSAGGGLCLALLLALKDLRSLGKSSLRIPAAGVCISPTTDMALTGRPNNIKGSVEPLGMAAYCSQYYVGKNDPRDPYISPLFGDLRGLPPILITVGDEENALDDSIRFADKAQAAGVDIKLMIGKGQVHGYPLLPDFIPESKQAMREITAFVHKNLDTGGAEPAHTMIL